jgi:hypothetical protein
VIPGPPSQFVALLLRDKAHCDDGNRLVVYTDEKLAARVELEAAVSVRASTSFYGKDRTKLLGQSSV